MLFDHGTEGSGPDVGGRNAGSHPRVVHPGQLPVILAVNDDGVQLRAIVCILEKEGLRVLPACSVLEALELGKQEHPDLIITDLYMPGIDGWRFCRLLRSPEYPEFNAVPILVISATFAGEHAEQITSDLGANVFLSAPFDASQLVAHVRSLLSGGAIERTRRVLVVDDCRTFTTMLAQAFARHGFEAHTAGTATEGRRLFQRHFPDIVILDYRLPDLEGDALLREFKRIHPLALVLMVTTDTTPELATRFLHLGADAYLRKPFDPEYLIELCRRAQRERALLRVEEYLEGRTRAVQESEEKYRTLFSEMVNGFALFEIVADTQGRAADVRFLDINPAGEAILGRSRMQLVGKTMIEVFGHLAAHWTQFAETIAASGERGHVEYFVQDLNKYIEVTAYRPCAGQVAAMFADITEHRLAEEKRALLATATEQAAESIFITDAQGRIEYANPSFERVTGYACREAIGQTPRLLKSGFHDAAFYRELWSTILRGEVWNGQLRNRRKDGSHYTDDVTVSPVRDSLGRIVKFVAVCRDVTREVELESQLRQSQKMEAIGTLAGGIAHDFNNILMAIGGYLDVALTHLPDDHPARTSLGEAVKGTERAASLVKQILTFSRRHDQQFQPVEIHRVVLEALKLLRSSLPTTLTIVEDINPLCGAVLADPTQIHQVLMNLCTNAYQAMREHNGVLTVELDVAPPEETGRLHTEAPPTALIGGYRPAADDAKETRCVRLTVQDTGHGMDAATLERIFDPFFTTKKVGEGSGLGLAITHGIVRQCNGCITVASEVGKGSVFRVFLPTAQGAPLRESLVAPQECRGTERILYVDDEQCIADVSRQILTAFGYRVTTYTDSAAALEQFLNEPEAFDLVITDQTMPRITGMELAREILRIRPALPVIIMTGYSELLTPELAKEIGIRELLMKPVTARNLGSAIRRALDCRV